MIQMRSLQDAEANGYTCSFVNCTECPRAREKICKYKNRFDCWAWKHEHQMITRS